MWRRIYVSFPSAEQARRVVAELERAGMQRNRLHTIAKSEVDIAGLPLANHAQRSDQIWLWERVFWYGNLASFVVALALAGLALYLSAPGWALVAATVAAAMVVLGRRFAAELPHVHLNEMSVPFGHGEAILLIDVPRTRVYEIQQLVTRHHPEAGVAGIGWTIASAGV